MKPLVLIGTALTLGVLTMPAVGHDAVLSCPTTPGGLPTASADAKYGVPKVTPNPDGTFTLTWPDGYHRTKPAPTGCAAPPPPEQPTPAPTPQPPEVTPPAVVVDVPPSAPTCSDLRALYPKAGPARLRAWGCPQKAARRLTCADVPRSAGPAWYNGSILGFRCPSPHRKPPRHVAVAGSADPPAIRTVEGIATAMITAGPAQQAPTGPAIEFTSTSAHLYNYYYRSGKIVKPHRVKGWTAWRCTTTPGLKVCTTRRTTLQIIATARWTVTKHDATLIADAATNPNVR